MSRLSLAVLKAHRLRNTAAFGSKQNIYLRLVAGSAIRKSDVVSDAGTDCALGEVFSLDLPLGVQSFVIEVIAKHNLTGDEEIGTATLSLDQVRQSNGDVIRAPVMSKKGMAGELEVTASVADAAAASAFMQPAATVQSPYPATPPNGPYSNSSSPYASSYPQQQQPPAGMGQPVPATYPTIGAMQQQPYSVAAGQPQQAAGPYYQQQPAPYASAYPPQQQWQQQQGYGAPPGAYPPSSPVGSAGYAPAAARYPTPAGYPQPAVAPLPQQQLQPLPLMQQPQQPMAPSTGPGRGSGMMGTALAAGAGALGGAVIGGAVSNAMFGGHHNGWGGGGGCGGPGGYYGGGDTVIENNTYITNDTTQNYSSMTDVNGGGGDWVAMDNGGGGGGDWVDMDNGGGDFGGFDDFGGGDW